MGFVCGAKHENVKTERYESHKDENMEFRNTRREGGKRAGPKIRVEGKGGI